MICIVPGRRKENWLLAMTWILLNCSEAVQISTIMDNLVQHKHGEISSSPSPCTRTGKKKFKYN